MNIYDMKRKDFEKLSYRKWNEDVGEFDSIIILPSEVRLFSLWRYKIRVFFAEIFNLKEPEIYEIYGVHDSGFRCMNFVAVRGDKPICLLSGCSDVIHFSGIGGFGKDWLQKYRTVPQHVPPVDWSIDCLLNNGLLRVFVSGKMTCGPDLSSFEIYKAD